MISSCCSSGSERVKQVEDIFQQESALTVTSIPDEAVASKTLFDAGARLRLWSSKASKAPYCLKGMPGTGSALRLEQAVLPVLVTVLVCLSPLKSTM